MPTWLTRTEPRKLIYVGKAVSSGSRTGGRRPAALPATGPQNAPEEVSVELALETLSAEAPVRQSNSLFKRLGEHSASIRKAQGTLLVQDFEVRVIPMADALVQWAEAVMIKRLRPVWNAQISGFGNHDPGRGRYQQARSIWDHTESN
ncbi:Eco29kI family restriction endonuclease [Deinococcus sp.]|uniref:Eco29kI family restriction endonuclease n=1 Tax=Deinococcus sp. TaxID=47478 RepID=UPI003C7E012C